MMRKLVAVAVLGLALSGCNTAYNYFEDDTEGTPTRSGFNLAHSMMKHAGVVPKDKAKIAHRPRPPLAMPGTTQLPSPQGKDTSSVKAAVNFPTDHEESEAERKARLAALLQNGQTKTVVSTETGETINSRLLSLPPEAVAKKPQGDRSLVFKDKSPVRSLKDMRKKLRFRTPAQTLLTEDGKAAPRRYLMQPPDAYRTPAATAALPEEGDIENSEWVKKRVYKNAPSSKPHTYIKR
ncbi:MAG: hypothetical protein AAGF45_12365 [Pseudomonadota bacterium]